MAFSNKTDRGGNLNVEKYKSCSSLESKNPALIPLSSAFVCALAIVTEKVSNEKIRTFLIVVLIQYIIYTKRFLFVRMRKVCGK